MQCKFTSINGTFDLVKSTIRKIDAEFLEFDYDSDQARAIALPFWNDSCNCVPVVAHKPYIRL